MPRNGGEQNTVWLPRFACERRIAEVLNFPGVHICIDGPTGTGKSSLAITQLSRARLPYVLVQVTESMNWSEFCKLLVEVPSVRESSASAEVEAGIVGGIPHGGFRITLGTSQSRGDQIGLASQVAAEWSEHDVCKRIVAAKAALFIDDFERAKPEIVSRVADMCKLLTESYVAPYAKLIIVGTDDVYRRLYHSNPSIEARLEEITVGTLPTASESWKFLQMGFEALGLVHPATDRHVSKKENTECMRAVYYAADGLPKSLNELGRDISLKGRGRNRVSPDDIKKVAEQMPAKQIRLYRREFPALLGLVERSPAVRAIALHLYSAGIGQIHSWSEVVDCLSQSFPEDQLDTAVAELLNAKFLVQTGRNGDTLYVTNPRLAHTLGVVVEDPEKYGQSPEKYAPFGQLTLPFIVEDEPEQR